MAEASLQQRTQKPGRTAPTIPVPAAEGEVVSRPSQTASPASIQTAPKDGTVIKVFGHTGQMAKAYWRSTRAYSPRSLKWEPAQFWAIAHTSMKLDFEPKTWCLLATPVE